MIVILVGLLALGVFVPWVLLFVLWRVLRERTVERLKMARMAAAIVGVIAVLFAVMRHDTRDAVIIGLLAVFLFALFSGWLRRLMMAFAIICFVIAAWAGWLTWGAAHGIMNPQPTDNGAGVLAWVSVTLCGLLTWFTAGAGALCLWLARRPIIPLVNPAATPVVPATTTPTPPTPPRP